jgi:hypothetical protein
VRWGRGVRKQREVSEGLSRQGVLEVSGRRGLAPGWIGARVDHLAGDSDKIFCFVRGWVYTLGLGICAFLSAYYYSKLLYSSAYYSKLLHTSAT